MFRHSGYRILAFLCMAAGFAGAAAVQPAAAQSRVRLRVHVESCGCFDEFLRAEITWVDFVRQPQDADVQILSTASQTGAGGVERTLRFFGGGRFTGIDHELRAVTLPGEPLDVERRAVLRAVQVGLLGFAARDGLSSDFEIDVDVARTPSSAVTRDPWNFWVFQIGGSGSLESEESSQETSWQLGVAADRVTDNWRLSFEVEVESESERFAFDDRDDVRVTRRERSVEWFLAKALGAHWSVGIDGEVLSSTFGNVELLADVAPAVEFNVFPYDEYVSRQLRIEYAVGGQHARYNEVTLFGMTQETRPRHQLSATLEQRQPWGSLESGVEWSQYLHDLSKSRLEFQGAVNLRLIRGLSLELGGSASRIRDQISLPRRGATPEEVLLRVRELQSGHELEFNVGLTYSFGSIFNNVVNPRFGRN